MKILFFSGLEDNRMSLYRGHGPLSELHKLDNSIEILNVPNNYFNTQNCKGYDLAYFHRPDNKDQVNAIKMLKKMNIPVIVDYDDDFLTCPEYSPYHVIMKLKKNNYMKNVCDILILADFVIVSTEELKKQYGIFNNNITVVPNTFDDYLFNIAKEFNSNSKIVFWRGGHTHEQDLFVYKDVITKLIKENEDFNFIFQGDCLPEWINVLSIVYGQKNITVHPIVDVFSYFWNLQDLKPALFLVPLEENQFNKSKSDIAALEATISGSLALTPPWEEWSWNTLTYTDPDSFYNQGSLILEELRLKSSYLQEQWTNNIQYIQEHRLLSEINKIRLKIILANIK